MRREESISSTAISSASYDDETKTLEVSFTSGQTYTFQNVPVEIFEGLISAPSAGKYYHSQIKGQFV
jgi:hypothetical protein